MRWAMRDPGAEDEQLRGHGPGRGAGRRRGRPPGVTAETARQVLAAALRLLTEEGAEAVTPQRIHEVTGVSRTTVYRHWPDRAALIGATLAQSARAAEPSQPTGDLERDLDAAVRSLLQHVHRRPLRPMVAAMLTWMGHPHREAGPGRRFIEGLLMPIREVLRRAIERGQVRAEAIDDLIADLVGPLLFQHLILGRNATDAMGERAVRLFIERYGVHLGGAGADADGRTP